MNQEIFIQCNFMSIRELKDAFEQVLGSSASSIRLEERSSDTHRMRSDPVLLVYREPDFSSGDEAISWIDGPILLTVLGRR